MKGVVQNIFYWLIDFCINNSCVKERSLRSAALPHFKAIKWKSRGTTSVAARLPLDQWLRSSIKSIHIICTKTGNDTFSQFISFLFDSCYHWCLKLIQKVEYGWAAWGEWKQDYTRWDQTDDSSTSLTSLVRLNRIFLSLVLTIWFYVLIISVIFFSCFEQNTLCLPDMISFTHVN